MAKIGRQVGGSAAILLGLFILLWHDFAAPWENVPFDGTLRTYLAYATGVLLLAAGAAMFWRPRPASLVLAAICACFTFFWVLAVAHAPLVYDGWGNVAEESSVAVGFLALYAALAPRKTDAMARLALGARVWFGVCSISFCVVHFTIFSACVGFVPAWMPFGGVFWTFVTAVAHLSVAVALLSGIWALLAARLAAIMYLGFGIVGWGSVILAQPKDHFAWGGEIITLVLAAGVWMVGDSIAAFPPKDGALFRWGKA